MGFRGVFRTILHPTDFSDTSGRAFDHALRISLAAKGQLHLLHVSRGDADPGDLDAFPGVRQTLVDWGLLPEGTAREEVAEKIGVHVTKIEMIDRGAVRGILRYLEENPTDLIVLATHGRQGVPRWLQGSITEPVTRQTSAATLCIRHGARGFVGPDGGEVTLRNVLVPIDTAPDPGPAVDAAVILAQLMGAEDVVLHLLHVGEAANAPTIPAPVGPIRVEQIARPGEVVGEIVAAAGEVAADLVAMTSAGRRGFLDEIRGSTTERVLRDAPCPVLVVPAG
ncbi:MAG: universal stress protein [Pseudomonadota bacterium]